MFDVLRDVLKRRYADNRLRDPNNPFDVVNRRISIIVKYNY